MRIIKLLLSDRSRIFLEGISHILEGRTNIEIVGICKTETETLRSAKGKKPDIILMDSEFGCCSDADLIKNIHQHVPMVSIVVMGNTEKVEDFICCIKAGAMAYISKNCSTDDLIRTINLVAEGNFVVSPPLAAKMVKEFVTLEQYKDIAKLDNCEELSKREQRVISLVSRGLSNKDIAAELCISEQTVKVHMRNVMGKLHVQNRQQAVAAVKFISQR